MLDVHRGSCLETSRYKHQHSLSVGYALGYRLVDLPGRSFACLHIGSILIPVTVDDDDL